MIALFVSNVAVAASSLRTVHVHQYAQFTVRGFMSGSRLTATLIPRNNKGGNCCGRRIATSWLVAADGSARVRFSWPATYLVCGGPTSCSTSKWSRNQIVLVEIASRTLNHVVTLTVKVR